MKIETKYEINDLVEVWGKITAIRLAPNDTPIYDISFEGQQIFTFGASIHENAILRRKELK